MRIGRTVWSALGALFALIVFVGFGAVIGFGAFANSIAFADGAPPSLAWDLETATALAHVGPIEIEVAIPRIEVYELGRRHGFEVDFSGAAAVNEALRERAVSLIGELLSFGNVTGGYDVHVDAPGVLSVTMQYSGYLPPMAHPMHLRASVTANPATGDVYTLADLFADDRYIEVISATVATGIEEQELPLLVPFDKVSPDQDFYLTAESLVLYYQLYELVPYAWGFPEFEIPLDSLREIVREDGPIAALIALK